ncbi:MAG: NUDIX hydrolase [bacterium]|nr:NUDIX hydrolase [bacterium]
MKFYKIRALALLYIVRFFARILFVEMVPIVSVAAIIRRGSDVLFVDLSYMKGVGLPGGIVQAGEDLEQALRREVKEETGLELVNCKYLGSVVSSTKGLATLSVVFSVEVSGEMRPSREGAPVWLDPKEALHRLSYDSNKIAIERYLN